MTDQTPGHPGWHGSLEGEPINDTPSPEPSPGIEKIDTSPGCHRDSEAAEGLAHPVTTGHFSEGLEPPPPDVSIAAQAAELLEDADAFITEHYPDAEMHLRLAEMVTIIRTSKRRKTDGFDTWNAIVAQRDEALAQVEKLQRERDKWKNRCDLLVIDRVRPAEAENAKLRDVVEAARPFAEYWRDDDEKYNLFPSHYDNLIAALDRLEDQS